MGTSIWQEKVTIKEHKTLQDKIHVDTLVIGGGMAGILTAYLLKEAGISVALLEADRICSGQTKNTTAKITSQHGMIYRHLTEAFGEDQARQYALANEQAIQEYARIVKKQRIDCDFIPCKSYLYAMEGPEGEERARLLEEETQTAARLGIRAEFTKETELPFSVAGAEVFENQAMFHPLKFVRKLAQEFPIYEHSRVLQMEDNCAVTEKGLVEAEHVVFTVHYPWMVTPGYYFMRMYQERSYVLALQGVKQFQNVYRDMESQGLSFRSSGEYLILGGSSHRTGENSEGGEYDALRRQAGILFPGAKEVAHWSAQDCITLDQVPYIGYFASDIPNWYVATGFGKWGMTSSMAAAVILRDMIQGKENKNEAVFSPQRFSLQTQAKPLMDQGVQGVKGLTRRIFSFPVEKAEGLKPGSGGIVEYEGNKAGVYKDEKGHVYAIEPKCSHMGCELAWNPEENSWDCPCHGSRYDFTGRLICGPAQEDLKDEASGNKGE